ncbi:LppA family lipoprotein [Nocardia sp. NPDC059180]|uniref:LppA family lipoprotein n=1 Tax=Nocardia sp. NPDC059180 TaxID=3346761 RepID=UPI00369D113B
MKYQQTRFRPRFFAAATAIMLSATSCGLLKEPDPGTSPAGTAEAARLLAQLPSLEETEAAVNTVLLQMAAIGTELSPGLSWVSKTAPYRIGCDKPFDNTNGEKTIMSMHSSPPMPDDDWPAFRVKSQEIAESYGKIEVIYGDEGKGRDKVNFRSDDGAGFNISNQGETVISAGTPCRLPEHVGKDQVTYTPIVPTTATTAPQPTTTTGGGW